MATEPGFQVHFVDGDGRFEPVGLAAQFHPGGVLPLVRGDVPDHGGGFRRRLAIKGIGIGLELPVSCEAGTDVVFVRRSRAETGDEISQTPPSRRPWDGGGCPSR